MVFAQALFFSLPFVLVGIVHIFVIKFRLLEGFARWPLDFRMKLRGRRVFGGNKTFRGAITIIAAMEFWIYIQSIFVHSFPSIERLMIVRYDQVNPLLWGALLGVGWVIGELPNSFVKRQLDINPGEQATQSYGLLFWLIDQVDSLIGVLACASIVWKPTLRIVFYLLLITIIIHPAGAYVMLVLGLKRKAD